MNAVMQTAIATAVAAALAKQGTSRKTRTKKAGGKREKLTDAQKAAYMVANDTACIKAFAEKGIQDVQPRVNVLTYDKWVEQGRRVRKGQKSTQVGPFRLFHISDTDPIAAEQVPA